MSDRDERAGIGLSFEAVYEQHFDFVWRTMRYMGVPESSVDDAVQEAFLVVHRRLHEFEGRASIQTWLFSIVHNIARFQRRTLERRTRHVTTLDQNELEEIPSGPGGPFDAAQARQAATLLSELLKEVDEDKRALFALIELEQMSMQDACGVLGINIHTAHSRLRRAREQLQDAIRRYKARQKWREE